MTLGYHQITLTDVTGSAGHVNVNPGDVYVFSWDTQTVTGDWAGSATATEVIMGPDAMRAGVTADVGAVHSGTEPPVDPTKAMLIELLRNGVAVASINWDNDPSMSTPPRTVLSYSGAVSPGDAFSVQLTVSADSSGSTRVDDGAAERGGFFPAQNLTVAEFREATPAPWLSKFTQAGSVQDWARTA